MMNAAQISTPLLCLAARFGGPDDEPSDERLDATDDTAALRILIVEDEFFIALDIQAQVEALGHAVVGIAVTADQAVELAGEAEPDVALMDIRLGGHRDGIAAAVEIRERFGIETIFVTANTDPDTLRRAQSIKPVGVLQKPLTRDRLGEELARLGSRSGGR